MPRILSRVNFGDTITLASNEGEKTVCRVSIDDLPDELRALHALSPLQWTVYARPLPTRYPNPKDPIVYVMLRIVFGHGGMSINRDVDATAIAKTTGAGSSVEVRARFVDVRGQTVDPADPAFAGITAIVNVVISPGVDVEAEPQLFWSPVTVGSADAPLKLPIVSVAFNPNALTLLTQQRLRRVRVTQNTDNKVYVQTHDSVAAPVAGAVPITSDILQPEPAQLDVDWGHQGHSYSKGCWVVLSTTEGSLTYPAPSPWFLQGQLYRLDSADGTE